MQTLENKRDRYGREGLIGKLFAAHERVLTDPRQLEVFKRVREKCGTVWGFSGRG
jgi:hypothetical protein